MKCDCTGSNSKETNIALLHVEHKIRMVIVMAGICLISVLLTLLSILCLLDRIEHKMVDHVIAKLISDYEFEE